MIMKMAVITRVRKGVGIGMGREQALADTSTLHVHAQYGGGSVRAIMVRVEAGDASTEALTGGACGARTPAACAMVRTTSHNCCRVAGRESEREHRE